MRKSIYQNLEKMMVKYRDLVHVQTEENNEEFTVLDRIPSGYKAQMSDMRVFFGGKIIVRTEVAKRLKEVQKKLFHYNSALSLYVTYGYRSLEVQTKNFSQQLQKMSYKFFPDPIDLYEETHRFIAVPTVGGHPTGGAVDVILINRATKKMIDFGGKLYKFSKKDCYTFYPNITEQGKKNRMLLRSLMMESGFAPFDGEWWHFSYGDREWAYYYKQPYAFYEQKLYKEVKKNCII